MKILSSFIPCAALLFCGCDTKRYECNSPSAVAEVSAKLAKKLDANEPGVKSHTVILDKKSVKQTEALGDRLECEVKAVIVRTSTTTSAPDPYPYLVGYSLEYDKKGNLIVTPWLK